MLNDQYSHGIDSSQSSMRLGKRKHQAIRQQREEQDRRLIKHQNTPHIERVFKEQITRTTSDNSRMVDKDHEVTGRIQR
jgi:hypothetical protein